MVMPRRRDDRRNPVVSCVQDTCSGTLGLRERHLVAGA